MTEKPPPKYEPKPPINGGRRFSLSSKSLQKLEGVHPHLVQVVILAIQITEIDFVVLEGLRTRERQRELFASGASHTLNSRHLTGHAVDLGPWVNDEVSWHWPHYNVIADAMKNAAGALSIPIEWGGDWITFKDGPHFQLPWNVYPDPEKDQPEKDKEWRSKA